MIGELPFHVAPGATETPWDYASRLAVCNLRENAVAFCADFGIAHAGLANGDDDAIRRLATLADVDPSTLLAHAFRHVGHRRQFVFRNELVTKSRMNRGPVKVCPICIEEDFRTVDAPLEARPHRRALWILNVVRTCERHGVALVDLRPPAPPASWYDTSIALSQALLQAPALVAARFDRSPSKLERYVTDRLFGTKEAGWIDTLALHVVIDIAPIVGLVATEGPLRSRHLLRAGDRTAYEDAGTEIMSGGEASFRKFLGRITTTAFHQKPVAWGPRRLLGTLYERLAAEVDHDDFQPLRSVIFDHMNATLPVGPNDFAFGQPFSSRKLHSLQSAGNELGMDPRRLGKVLERAGVVVAVDRSPERVLFDAQAAAPLLRSIRDAFNLKEFGDYLGIQRLQAESILNSGLLEVLDEYVDTNGHHRVLISRTEADDFLNRLRQKADPNLPIDDLHSLPKASRICSKPMEWILELLMGDQLSTVGIDTTKNVFLSLLVDSNELKRIVNSRRDNLISLQTAEKILNTNRRIIKRLALNGYLDFVNAHSRNNNLSQLLLNADSVDVFRREYISFYKLARERGVHFRKLLQHLRSSGVNPIDNPETVGATFFRRSDLELKRRPS